MFPPPFSPLKRVAAEARSYAGATLFALESLRSEFKWTLILEQAGQSPPHEGGGQGHQVEAHLRDAFFAKFHAHVFMDSHAFNFQNKFLESSNQASASPSPHSCGGRGASASPTAPSPPSQPRRALAKASFPWFPSPNVRGSRLLTSDVNTDVSTTHKARAAILGPTLRGGRGVG